MELNPYKIKWALSVDSNNIMDFGKSIHAANHESLLEKIKGLKGKFFIIIDKQFGLIQNAWNDTELKTSQYPNVDSNVWFDTMGPHPSKVTGMGGDKQ